MNTALPSITARLTLQPLASPGRSVKRAMQIRNSRFQKAFEHASNFFPVGTRLRFNAKKCKFTPHAGGPFQVAVDRFEAAA